MTAFLPFGGGAVMSTRHEPPDSLDFFPTPPWATRALCEIMLGADEIGRANGAWEPACGEGHMAETLKEYFPRVLATDIHPYGYGGIADFMASRDDVIADGCPDWIITNPAFNVAVEFARTALAGGERGVALLCRTAWLETGDRFELFLECPPDEVCQFVERVPMHRGRYEPEGGTMTAYAWFVWRPMRHARTNRETRLRWIPPCKHYLFRPEDVRRWCKPAEIPLFEGGVDA